MRIIYEPKGRAREYSPLAANYYNGCDHRCKYCYVPEIKRQTLEEYGAKVTPRRRLFEDLERDVREGIDKQVFLSFAGDPYCHADVDLKLTRKMLELFLKYKVPTAILSKGGHRMIRDLDIILEFGKNIKVGSTLVFIDGHNRREQEPGAASTRERLETLEAFHDKGVRTWASMEPVMNTEHSLTLIRESLAFVDEYKLGKVNHAPMLETAISWGPYLKDALEIIRPAKKMIYVKHDLLQSARAVKVEQNEKTLDGTALGSWVD